LTNCLDLRLLAYNLTYLLSPSLSKLGLFYGQDSCRKKIRWNN
jgi:hypothetical protein